MGSTRPLATFEVEGGSSMGQSKSADQLEAGLPLLRSSKAGNDAWPAAKPNWRRNAGILACMGALLVFLVVMAAVHTGRNRPAPPAMDPCERVPGERACVRMVNPVVQREADYRGTPRVVTSQKGVVAADQGRCSDIGAAVLDEGGNAVDAAIAATLCQGVLNPFASGIGGGFFMVIRLNNGSAEVINARETAPKAADKDMYTGKASSASTLGGLAVAVPLELKGLELAHQRHGRLPWRRLVAPAAALAMDGFPAYPYLLATWDNQELLRLARGNPHMREAFLVKTENGTWRVPYVGEQCCRRPQLANTLRQVGEYGASWLYSGERAQALARDIQAAGGIITASDLESAETRLEPALSVPLPSLPLGSVSSTGGKLANSSSQAQEQQQGGPLELLIPGPPSSAIVMAMALRIIMGFPALPQGLTDPATPPASRLAAQQLWTYRALEALKHGFALRMHLGDPGTPKAPFLNLTRVMADLRDPAFADTLRATISDAHVLNLTEYGGPWNPLRNNGSSPVEDNGTSHLGVVDAERNAVSITTTVNGPFGANFISPSTGILLNNEMDDFSRPDMPNAYGLAPAAANFIAPGKRPLSSMAPTILTQGGKLRMVAGASGGPRILTATFVSIARALMLGTAPLDIVALPRFHNQFLPDSVLYERWSLGNVTFNISQSAVNFLQAQGNNMQPRTSQLGTSQIILVNPATGQLVGASDPRKDGAPAAMS